MLHVHHPLLQFADITDPLLSTAARFYDTIRHGSKANEMASLVYRIAQKRKIRKTEKQKTSS